MTASAEPTSQHVPAPRGRAPDFYIVGHAKCGTTALYEMLSQHPAIFMPELKEPLYFATDLRLRFQRRAAGSLPTELEDYLALFEPAGTDQLIGEASSSYLWSREAAGGIAALRPDAKIIAILREPASFLRSLHLQLLQNHIETEKDMRRAIELESERREGRQIPKRSVRPQALLYSERVRYVDQLRRYHAQFRPEQVLVLIYDDFRNDNEGTVRQVLRFLELDENVSVKAREANPTVRMRSQLLDDAVHAVSVGAGPASRSVKAFVKALTPAPLRRRALRAAQQRLVLAPPRSEDEQLSAELRRRYRHEVVALSEYLDRDLVGLWGYDGDA
jgi:hypothetical protein